MSSKLPAPEKIVLVTRKTQLEELVERFGTVDQARFYLERMGGGFAEYQAAHDAYHRAFDHARASIPPGARWQSIERGFLPNFSFGPRDLVATLGPDGLVVNTAKYLDGQPLLAFNPDQARVDGVLLPFAASAAPLAFRQAMEGSLDATFVTMAQARLNDGQRLLALNDLFIGAKTHVSARYTLSLGRRRERQSSSGVIVSTGAGSTGWHRSILVGAHGIVGVKSEEQGKKSKKDANEQPASARDFGFPMEAKYLRFHVREPFPSRTSGADLVHGVVEGSGSLEIVSEMPQNGVIFSDGVESDFLDFNSGAIATIGVAERRLRLLRGAGAPGRDGDPRDMR